MNDRDLQLVRRLRDESSAPPEEVLAARERLFAAIQEEIDGTAVSARRRRSLPRFATARLAAAAAAVAVVLVAVVVGSQLLAPPAAVAGLTELARVAEITEPPAVTAGSGIYVRSDRSELVQFAGEDLPGVDDAVVSFLLPQTREVWLRADGTRRLRVEVGIPVFFDPATEAAFYAAGFDAVYGVGIVDDVELARPEVDLDVGSLPADPDALEGALRQSLTAATDEHPVEVRLFELAGALLRETSASPELRAAALEVLAGIDGIELVEDTEQSLAVGLEFSVGDAGFVHTLAFDRASSALTGERVEYTGGDAGFGVPAGTALVEATYSIPTVRTLP